MSFAPVIAVVVFFFMGFYILRWVQRKSTQINLPKLCTFPFMSV